MLPALSLYVKTQLLVNTLQAHQKGSFFKPKESQKAIEPTVPYFEIIVYSRIRRIENIDDSLFYVK